MLVTLSCIPYFIWATGLFLLNIDLEHKTAYSPHETELSA